MKIRGVDHKRRIKAAISNRIVREDALSIRVPLSDNTPKNDWR